MAVYTKGAINVQFKGRGGTWRAVDQNDLGFLLWESELYGDKAKKILTDIEGNIILKEVGGFSDFKARLIVNKYEDMRNQPVVIKSAQYDDESNDHKEEQLDNIKNPPQEEEEIKRPSRKKVSSPDPRGRESVISKLREYQEYIDKVNARAKNDSC